MPIATASIQTEFTCLAAWVSGLLALAAAAALACTAAAAAPQVNGGLSVAELAQGFRDGTVVARPKAAMLPVIGRLEQAEGLVLRASYKRFGNVRVLRLAPGDTVKAAVRRLMATGRYEYVEPDYVRHVAAVPDDPQFSSQWGLNNTGVGGGVAGADIHAEDGWNTLTSASGIIAAIVDSGALTTHQDLVANLWVNPAPNTTKTYGGTQETDSLNGLNAVTRSGVPTDDLGHGTHVSGIVGAVGNNGLGVSGVAWKVQLMELKFIDSSGSGSTSAELPCIDYAIEHGASVINASFGDQSFAQSEMDAIHAAGQAGVIFVCAAGNSSENIDISPFFPADYPLDNIICVGASDNRDLPVYFSNYGSGSVEIFAPGESILSTYFSSDSSYQYLSGTSMASPMVTGTVALLRSRYPGDTYRQTINRVLNSADANPGLAGKAQTGGRVDLAKALTTAANTPPNMLFENRTTLVGLDPYTRSNNVDSPAVLEAGTPEIAGMAGSHSLWWQWTAPQNANVEIDTSGTGGGLYPGGSTYSTLLGVYTGTSLSSLTPVASSANFGTEPVEGGNGSTASYSEVTFHAVAGTTYQINVQGQSGESGQTILAINTTPDNELNTSPTVLTGPSTSVLDANPGTNGQPLWYSWTPPFSGPAQVSAYSYDFTVKATVYTGTAPSSLATLSSAIGSAPAGTTTVASECLCTFTAVAGTTYLISVGGANASDVGEFTVGVADSQWQAATGDAVTCSPAVGPDGSLYVGSNDNTFYAFNPDGSVKWTHAGTAVFDTSSAAVGPDGSVYAGCTDGNLYAFTPGGTLNWTYTVPTPTASSGLDNGLSSSPALGADGTVCFHDDDGNLYAISSLGALNWKEPVPGVSYAAPTIAPDGTIYVGSDAGLLYAFNPDGTKKWTFTAPVAGEEIYTAAAIDAAGNLYFGTLSGNFYSVSSAGSLRWSFSTSASISSAPALANGAVYFGGYDGNLYSLSTASGSVNWKYPLGTQVRASSPAVDANGVIYIGCYDHNVYAISQAGTLVRIYASDDYIRSSPVIGGSTLCFGSEDHKVYSFSLAAGPAAADWPMYQYNARRLGRAVSSVLEVTTQPASQSVAPGSGLTLSVVAVGPGAITYQWSLNGTAIAGAVNSTYSVASASFADAGTYTVTVTSGSSSVTSAAAVVTVSANAAGRLVNLSARASVGTGGNILIAGFVLGGTGSKTMLLRGVGPALGIAPFNVTGFLAQPQLTLVDTSTNSTFPTVTNWGADPALSNSLFASDGAFSFPLDSDDSAELETLSAGSYTSEVAGVNSTTGIALAEIYDTDPGSTSLNLLDISARADVGTGGNILIAGFVIEGSQPAQVLLRGIGPTLGAAPFSLTGVLAQPEINLYNTTSGTSVLVATNTGWGSTTVLVNAFTQAGAFQLPAGSADAAMIETLPAGNYTLELSGQNGTTGIGLVEVYLLP